MNYNEKRDHFISPILEWAKANAPQQNVANSLIMAVGDAKSNCERLKDGEPFKVPSQFNGKDYITMLLQIDAEIEQGLMLQYLYSAYSMGGANVPEKYQEKVHTWQNIILGIAKEEMGHFISVQNVLKVIGAPLNFGRESYPWDSPFYPFPFTLEKFSLKSLAKYVYAEAPCEWLAGDDELAIEIRNSVDSSVSDPHTVGALFVVLLQLIKDPAVISDETFQAATYNYQAKFDEWGRGYKGGSRGSDGQSIYTKSPDVLVAPLLSRDDAYQALSEIAEQGEGLETDDALPSHFERFLHIYKEYKEILEETNNKFDPSRNVATNPYVGSESNLKEELDAADSKEEKESDEIKSPEAILWANLCDIRYRLLLNFLNHSFLLDNGFNNSGNSSPRGMIINSAFGEMYNLRSLATILVQTPISKSSSKVAGPPFTLPYTFDLPFGEHNRWRLHRDLLEASNNIIVKLKNYKIQPHIQYLNGLQEADQKLLQAIARLTEENLV
ncbi:ferritin-like protein [Flavobacterium sp. 90]|uniref:ferritin-like domain-containing protein n=1 Tax=unclassified Flavobacterium TaxID=196869 RepID=UPI000EB35920|nr:MULTISPECIES: ferritin-like protein [unclassified Flavobacterium]RKR05548.1 ferritin-like protein [Flavobacterium sp. 81]TCK56863.1 ferritin-like protein [Flavobacterium sp. 90]